MTFTPHHAIEPVEFERGYLIVVLDGAVAKTFARAHWALERDSLATLPPGCGAPEPVRTRPDAGARDPRARPLDARADPATPPRAGGGRDHARVQAGGGASAPPTRAGRSRPRAWRCSCSRIASRVDAPAPQRRACWLRDAHELLHDRAPQAASLSGLAAEVGVHPAHLARSFRQRVRRHRRRVRAHAQARVGGRAALGDEGLTLAQISVEAGYADQSHFTRARSAAGRARRPPATASCVGGRPGPVAGPAPLTPR